MKTAKLFYIKERHNPQLGVHYYKEGKLTKREARNRENAVYGTNILHSYETEEEYNQACLMFNAR